MNDAVLAASGAATAVRSSGGRIEVYDEIRVVAMVFVVAVHSLAVVDTTFAAGVLYHNFGQAMFFTANALFFMLSGRFNMRVMDSDASFCRYYVKRLRNFMLPVLVFFLIRTLYNLYPDFVSVSHVIWEYLKNALVFFNSMEYWFVFTLFGFLLVAPFLARIFVGLSDFQAKVFLGIGLAYNLIVLITTNREIDFGWGYLFSGFALAFCMGALIERLFSTRRQVAMLAACSVICLLITVWNVTELGWWTGSFDQSPFYTVLAMGIYAGILYLRRNARPNRAISFLAGRSFSVYLTHMMILNPLTKVIPDEIGAASFGMHIAVTIGVLAASIACATVIDFAVIKPLQRLFDKVWSKLFPPKESPDRV